MHTRTVEGLDIPISNMELFLWQWSHSGKQLFQKLPLIQQGFNVIIPMPLPLNDDGSSLDHQQQIKHSISKEEVSNTCNNKF